MKKLLEADTKLLLAIVVLVFFGVIMVLSASMLLAFKRFNTPYSFFFKHLMWTIIGFGGLYAAVHVKTAFIRKNARWFYIIMTATLAAVLFFGREINGARRWFDLGFTTFQPSEAMKVAMIIFLADYLDRKKSRIRTPGGFARLAALIAIPLGLILAQPDLGGVVVIVCVSLVMFFLAGVKFRYLAAVGLICFAAFAAAIIVTPYRMARVKNFAATIMSGSGVTKTPTGPADVESQQGAALAALARGGWFGAGPGSSRLKMFYLPEPHTDFVFAVIGEELGYLGAASVLGLFFLLFARGLKVAASSDDVFVSLTAAGITVYFTVQALFHIGVSCGLVPTKGLTLPFISFGGSSLIVSLAAAGLLLNFSTRMGGRAR